MGWSCALTQSWPMPSLAVIFPCEHSERPPGRKWGRHCRQTSTAISEVESGSVILMFGGTPSNVSLTLLSDAVEVVTGVNLPMLLSYDLQNNLSQMLPDLRPTVEKTSLLLVRSSG